MKDLENELRAALRRPEPPPGFTNRVLARIARLPAPQAGRWQGVLSLFRVSKLRWAAASVVICLVMTIGVAQYRRAEHERAKGEAAKVQLMQALQIASTKLNVALKKVQETDRRYRRP